MSRLDRKLGIWLGAAFLAAVSAGCALDAAEQTEVTGARGTDLQEVPAAAPTTQAVGPATAARPNAVSAIQAPSMPLVIPAQPLEAPTGPGFGNDKDDPRPHPWQPPSAGGTTGGSSGTDPSASGDSTGATTGTSSK